MSNKWKILLCVTLAIAALEVGMIIGVLSFEGIQSKIFQAQIKNMERQLIKYKSKNQLSNDPLEIGMLDATDTYLHLKGELQEGKTIDNIFPNRYNNLLKEFAVFSGQLTYIGLDPTHKQWAEKMNIYTPEVFYKKTLVPAADIDYTESSQSLFNPDRGYFTPFHSDLQETYTDEEIDSIIQGTLDHLVRQSKEEYRSLFFLRYNLVKQRNASIDSSVIQYLNSTMDFLRRNGMKVILRFSYFDLEHENLYDNGTFGKAEPDSFSGVINHIEQLRPVFEQNKDVILLLQTGFLGAYGELHSSRYTPEQYLLPLMEKMAEVVPEPTLFAVRTPNFYQIINKENQRVASRTGIYNDGFLASEDDLWTFSDKDESKPLAEVRKENLEWLSKHNGSTLYGGETTIQENVSPMDNPLISLKNALYEMQTSKMSYLNYGFNEKVLSVWKDSIYQGDGSYHGEDGYKYIGDHLGYRFVLTDSRLPIKVLNGTPMDLVITLKNTGFGNVVQPKNCSLLFVSRDRRVDELPLDLDLRSLNGGESYRLLLSVDLPASMKEGQYRVYLKIADQSPDLGKNFSIRFANEGVYDSDLGANALGKVYIYKE